MKEKKSGDPPNIKALNCGPGCPASRSDLVTNALIFILKEIRGKTHTY
jgi:hypothetical protein